jgi:phosphatidate cytidylyltransferase
MHEKMRFEQMIVIAFLSIFIPFALSSITLLQIRFEQHGIFYIVFMLISAWIGDAGAYFIGTFFGKHKMAPKISPKKSWEGFFGGLFTSALFGVFLGLGYEWYLKSIEGFQTVEVDILFLCISALICSILGVVGDFSASIIKRQCSVKDFGHILPGHGGVLDRFDSVMFVAPFTYILFTNFSPIIAV